MKKRLDLLDFTMIGLLILIIGFLASKAEAADGPGQMTIQWTAPTKNTDGTNLTTLIGFRVIVDNKTSVDVPISQLSYQWSGLTPGSHTFVVRALTPAPPPDDISDPAGPITAMVTGLVTIDTTPYRQVLNLGPNSLGDMIMISQDVKAGSTFGTVPLGTLCDNTQTSTTHGVTYYRIDRTAVTFTGNNRPPVVYALCK